MPSSLATLRKFQGKLSRTGNIVLVLLVGVLLLNVGIRVLDARQAGTEETLTTRVRQSRITLDRAVQDSDLAPLQTKKQELELALSRSGQAAKDSADVTVEVWKWAAASNLDLKGLTVDSSPAKVGDIDVVAYRYMIVASGPADGVQRFVATATSSAYTPTITKLELKHGVGKPNFDASLDMVVYALAK